MTNGAPDIENYLLAKSDQTTLHVLRDGDWKRSDFAFFIRGKAENTHTHIPVC